MKRSSIVLFGLMVILIFIQIISTYDFERVEKIPSGENRIDYLAEKYLKEDSFDRIWMTKYTESIKDIRGETLDEEKINEIIDYFNELNLEQVSWDSYSRNIDNDYPQYHISFNNDKNYEDISIEISDDKYIEIIIETFIEEYDKKDKVTKYSNEYDHYNFKILDNSIDYGYLDEIIESIKE